MAFLSPFRYPGGKGKLFPLVKKILIENGLVGCTYVEPFAGGANLALNLLMTGIVDKIVINDIDLSIYAFWYSVLHETEQFLQMVEDVTIDLSEWYKQKEIFQTEKNDLVKLGFATFFLNRTNRSGVLKAGPIGGKKTNSKYPLDCRFNKSELSTRIRRIHDFKDKIVLYNLDAKDLLELDLGENLFFNLDPPYYSKGAELYTNFFQDIDHKNLADKVRCISDNWIVTYDDSKVIESFYQFANIKRINIQYTAQTKRVASELLIYPDTIFISE